MRSMNLSVTFPITKSPIISSLPTQNNNNNNSSTNSSVQSSPLGSKRNPKTTAPTPKKPSVAEIERAIGAGVFRDRDTDSDSEQSKTLFDTILSNSIGKKEGSVEKKLRQTGEWILERTEGPSSKSGGKQILQGVFLFILPIWIISFLVASGFIKLPFDAPFLDDLIM